MDTDVEIAKGEGCETSPGCSGYSSMVHSKKVIKHALRQQAKRRRKNTTIAAGNSRTLPRIVVKPLPPPPPNDPPSPVNNNQHVNTATVEEPAATMREVLASLPGFSLKSGRRRSTKRLSASAQLEAGLVDLESPASILASTSLRALLNRHTFQGLPPLYQRKLAQLLPSVDRQDAATSGLNNEFFARACLEWRKRLAEGEFTPENQQRLKMEAERDKNKLDPWKVKHFEPIWGEKREPKLRSGLHCITELRSSGAVTRSSLRLRLGSTMEVPPPENTSCDLGIVEEKIHEEENCKDEPCINLSREINDTHEVEEILLPKYNETTDSPTKAIPLEESTNLSPVTTDTENFGKLENFEQKENKEKSMENECNLSQTCQTRATNIYSEKINLPSCGKSLHQVEEQILEVTEAEILPFPEENSSSTHLEQISQAVEISQLSDECITMTDISQMEMTKEQEEQIEQISEEQIHQITDEQIQQISEEEIHQISDDQIQRISEEEIQQISEEQIQQISDEQIQQISEEQIYQMSECESTNVFNSPHNQVQNEIVMDDASILNNQAENDQISHDNPNDSELQIPEGMEIDSDTLQRIHELEVRGEMREAYEEISSGCTEEIMYPILEGMEIGTNNNEDNEQQDIPGQVESVNEQQDENVGNEDEALREANNYVCSEMLECSWTVDPNVNNVTNNNNTGNVRAQEELQVPWPLVAAALDGSVAANITITTQDECSETTTTTDSQTTSQQFINNEANVESVNCIQFPVVQGSPFQPEIAIGTPGTSCIMKNLQSQSPPIIAFPQLQSIRFVQTSFHSEPTTPTINNAITTQIQSQQSPQINILRPQEEVLQINSQNSLNRSNRNQSQNLPAVQPARAQSTILVHHPTTVPNQSRQILATIHQPQQQQQQTQQQQQQQFPGTTVSSRSSRASNQSSQRGSRSNNREQGSGRSRSSTKEPPGAVNLERSYQICQAVIQSSPNRDQLKAHLKPPPSLLARGDGAFTTSKPGGRTVTTVKTQKPQQNIQKNQAKTQAVMLRHVFATRQPSSAEATETSPVTQLGTAPASGLGQYILVQRTGVGDSAPRASSAPPLPPQIAGMGVGVHLVRGRPASAGEGSHQAVTLKARGASDGRGSGGAEPGAPGMIIGGDPPPPCECNMRGAMVICRQCGAFCHDDCIGPQRICATCLIR
ncbi:polycomb group protein Asx isoform X1 [Prorops nasuta]|uniref:polycomb group protein Asx isoform X1 n=1 Tax=Prorops nasuta TaxID=863751 RepID=UPI0034CFA893